MVEIIEDKWKYPLTPEEEAICAEVVFMRQKPYLGNPKANRNYSEGDTWEIWQHIIASGSELAFARMVGLSEFIPTVNTWRTSEDVPGYEIRYCFTNNNPNYPNWSLRFHELDDENKVYVLLAEGLEKKTRRSASKGYKSEPYVALGWMWGYECKKSEYEIMSSRYRSWRVPYTDIHPMSDLV